MLAPSLALAAALSAAQGGPALQVERPPARVYPASKDVLAGLAGGPVLTLDDALREAEAKSLDLRQARARLDQVREGVRKAWSAYLPQVSAAASYTRNSEEAKVQLPTRFAVRDTGAPTSDPGGGLEGIPTNLSAVPTEVVEATLQPRDQLALQLQASQTIFALPAWYAVGAARRGTEVAEDGAEWTRRQILFGVAQAYYAAVALKQALVVQERQLAIALEHEKDSRVRFEAGTVPKITLLRAEIDRARAELDLRRTQNSLASAKLALARLLDRADAAFDVAVPPQPRLPADLGALEAEAVRRPDVRAAATNVALQEDSRRISRARYLPALGAFGRYQIANAGGFSGQEDTWAVGLQATWSLFDGGLREAEIREAGARIVEAEAARRGTENRAREEVRQARLDLESAEANRLKAEEQLALARENQKLVEVNFRAGAATYLEVSDANGALTTAEISAISESLNEFLAATRLLQAAGQFQAR